MDGAKIDGPQNLEGIRATIDRRGPLILKHKFYPAARACFSLSDRGPETAATQAAVIVFKRTPRHIIRMMARMLDPRPGERICDPAAGTCGFLVNAWQHLLESHTDPRDLTFDDEGWPHGLTGSRLKRDEWDFAQTRGFTGFDSDLA